MRPILFQWGNLVIPSYTTLIMIGVLVATQLGIHFMKKYNLSPVIAIDLAIIGVLAGFVGGRIAHVLVEAPHYYLEAPIRVFYVWQGGFVSWGAHVALLLSWAVYLRWRKLSLWLYLDVASLVLCLLIFFGRIGCLMAGCCYGKPTDFIFHLTFTNPGSTAYHFYPNVPLHATQIYLMANVLFIQIILWWWARNRWRFQGELIALGGILYSIGRFLIEYLRGDVDRGVYFNGMISSGQIVMIGYFVAFIFIYLCRRKKNVPIPVKK